MSRAAWAMPTPIEGMFMTWEDNYSSPQKEYCTRPEDCLTPRVLFMGSAVGLYAAAYLADICPALRPGIVVADAGGLDLLTHVSNTDFPRFPILREGAAHFGGKLCLWGASAPRPPAEFLAQFPYAVDDLDHRFSMMETELGIRDVIPYSGRKIESDVCGRLKNLFPAFRVRLAPLAIDRLGRRWSPISHIPDLANEGVKFLARFRCTRLDEQGGSIRAVRGGWGVNRREYVLKPGVLVLALGVEQTLPLVRRLCPSSLQIGPADHIRIDLHGSLPAGSFGDAPVDELGIAVFLLEGAARSGVPYHLR